MNRNATNDNVVAILTSDPSAADAIESFTFSL